MGETESIAVLLPKATNFAWNRVCFYIVEFVGDHHGEIILWGGGLTIKECKQRAIHEINMASEAPTCFEAAQTMRMFVDATPDTVFYTVPKAGDYTRKFAMYLGEAKLYIYGTRYGFKKLRVVLDPYLRRNFLRYLGVRTDNDRRERRSKG